MVFAEQPNQEKLGFQNIDFFLISIINTFES